MNRWIIGIAGAAGSALIAWGFGWLDMVPWWGWLVVILVIAGVVWKFAGWPGLIALGGAIGFILGRRSQSPEPNEAEVDGADASAPWRKPGTANRTKGGGGGFDGKGGSGAL